MPDGDRAMRDLVEATRVATANRTSRSAAPPVRALGESPVGREAPSRSTTAMLGRFLTSYAVGAVGTAAGLDILVLGDLVARRDGHVVELGGRRQRAVVAALVVARGEPLSSDALVDRVWAEHAPENAIATLQSYISRLRRQLEPDTRARTRDTILARVGPGYVLRLPEHAVDAWRFERAVRAAAAMPAVEAESTLDEAMRSWRGPAFADYADEPWARAEVTRLAELRAIARERLLDARLLTGDASLLVPELELLVADDPLREERWRLLALALYRAQRQGDALGALRRARETLAEELGLDPGPALRQLEQDLLAQSPELDPAAGDRADRVGVRGEPGTATVGTAAATDDLLERERELSHLHDAAGALVAGRGGGIVMVVGAAGLGKTRLLTAVTEHARSAGLQVLSARGTHVERPYGFGVVRQLFEPLLLDETDRTELLAGPAAPARRVFDLDGDERGGEFATLHGLYWLTLHLAAQGPLVLAVDDVQWCDSSSLRFLTYLAKRIEGVPLLLVATLRTGETHPDEALLSELVLDPAARVLRPAPLTRTAVSDVVARRLGPPAEAFVEACWRTTAGNPLLVRQLVRALESDRVTPDLSHSDTVRAVGSRAVADLVTLRLRRMPADATLVARAVSVLQTDADVPAVAALSGLPEGATAAALEVLGRAEILRDERPPGFVHPLVGDAVRDHVPAAERALLHERAATILRRQGAPAERLVRHLVAAPPRAEAGTVAILRSAARTALSRGAPDTAVALLRRALREPPSGEDRPALLVELGRAEVLVDGHAAVPHLREAYAGSREHAVRAALAATIVEVMTFTEPRGRASDFARAAAAELPPDQDDARQGLVALERVAAFVHSLPTGGGDGAVPPAPRGDGIGARRLAAALAFERARTGRDRDGAVALARQALVGDQLLTAGDGLLWAAAANTLLLADAPLDDLWDRAMRQARASGSLVAVMATNLWRGFAEWRRGDLGDAVQSLADAEEQDRMWGGTAGMYIAAFTVGALLDRGDVDGAEAVLARAGEPTRDGDGERLLRRAAARLLLARGEAAAALAALDAAPATDEVAPTWDAWRGLRARALHQLGRTDEAIDLAAEEVALLRGWGAPSLLGPALRRLGRAQGPDGVGALREAVEVLRGSPDLVGLARARVSLGAHPGVALGEAVPLLRAALSAAVDHGADAVTGAAAAALTARGHPTRAEECPMTGPTRRLREVLDLTLAGHSVDEVADRLFLTPATVRRAIADASRLQVAAGMLADPRTPVVAGSRHDLPHRGTP